MQVHEPEDLQARKTRWRGAKMNEQFFRAFQNEIDFAQREIRKSEDRTLELMAESEPLDLNVKTG